MINIKRNEDCVGCEACRQRCPKSCIQMHRDPQGFLYPKVDHEKCIDCRVCEKVCPVITTKNSQTPIEIFAAKNPDEIERKKSSSGGVFIMLAKKIIAENGVVFGAKFNEDWEVEHGYCDTADELEQFMGSKYVQSHIGDSFSNVEKFLKDGRKVMFTGTPCQIAGLRLYLKKDYGNQLLTVDVICHGVPSPLVWNDYISHFSSYCKKNSVPKEKDLNSSRNKITAISFRDKSISWQRYGLRISYVNSQHRSESKNAGDTEEFFETLDLNRYLKGFLSDTYLRPSCYECPVKNFKSGSDITIGDYWGIDRIHPEFSDQSGVSVVICNTTSGEDVIKSIGLDLHKSDLSSAIKSNPALIYSATKGPHSNWFWQNYKEVGISSLEELSKKLEPKLHIKIKRKLKDIVRPAYNAIIRRKN